MIRVADYIAQYLADHGIKVVFMVAGGGAMFLNNAFGEEKRIRVICNHHEQACAMAAEGYTRTSGAIGVINVTTGPGGINALNGVFGAWTDSIPVLVISGQVKRETHLGNSPVPGLRQLGDQEAQILPMVRGITKYAVLVDDPQMIRYHLEKALYLAQSGRPGPCWLDIPSDVQSGLIDELSLPAYDESEDRIVWDQSVLSEQVHVVIDRIKTSKRPVILAGTGVRLANAVDLLDEVIHKLNIPVTTAWTHDLVASDDPVFCGRPGTIGDRGGNFAVQNADMLLIIGSRLNIRQVSYNWTSFARYAYKIWVDIDPSEFNKPTVKPDFPIHCDAKMFLEELDRQVNQQDFNGEQHRNWLNWCRSRVARYPVVLPKHRVFNGFINPYHFMEVLFSQLTGDDVIVTGNASACIMSFQVAFLHKGERLFSNSGSASMGYDLPAAIGAAIAREGKRIICLAGDGSIQMNIQEFQTLFHHHLPVKVFVLNNNGYLSIRTTQTNFFDHLIGEGPQSGVSFPDIAKVAQAYGIPSTRLDTSDFKNAIVDILNQPGPMVVDVLLDPTQTFEPKLSSKRLPDGRMVSSPLEDLFPFLERDELLDNLLIPPMEY